MIADVLFLLALLLGLAALVLLVLKPRLRPAPRRSYRGRHRASMVAG
jgi:hypothetical protein